MMILITGSPFMSLRIDRYGATERTVVERVRALRIAGIEVTLFAPNQGDAQPTEFIEMRRFSARLPTSRSQKIRWALTPSAYLQTLLYSAPGLDQDWDVVVNDGMPLDPLTGYLVASRLGLDRTINVLHGGLALDTLWIRGLGRLARRQVYGCQNLNLEADMRSMGFRAVYFPTGTFFPPSDQIQEEPEDRLVFVGRVAEHKGTHLAIQIAKKLGMRLSIVGPIGDREYFRTQVEPQLDGQRTYEGELPRAALLEIVRNSRALLFTSQNNDSQGLVLLEALSYGVPLIATRPLRHSGLYDILIEGENGTIVDPTSIHTRSIDNLFARNRRQIRDSAFNRWDWSAVIQNYYQPIFASITAGF